MSKEYPPKLAEMIDVPEETTVITFSGGDVYEGWIHEIYTQYPDMSTTFERWESGGYQESENEQEHPIDDLLGELAKRYVQNEEPLPRWTNKEGWNLWLSAQTPKTQIQRLQEENKILRGKISRRNKQIRDLRKSLTAKK